MEGPRAGDDNRLTRRFLAWLIVVMVGAIGVLASLVFLYTAHDEVTRGILDTTLVVSGATLALGVAMCLVTARRISVVNRASRHPPRR